MFKVPYVLVRVHPCLKLLLHQPGLHGNGKPNRIFGFVQP